MKPQEGNDIHISDFYRKQFVEQSQLLSHEHNSAVGMPLIRVTRADKLRGMEILAENGVMPTTKAIIMHPGSGGASNAGIWIISLRWRGCSKKREQIRYFCLGLPNGTI